MRNQTHEKSFIARVTEYVNALPEKLRHEFISLTSSSHKPIQLNNHATGNQNKTAETEDTTWFSAAAKPLSRARLRKGIKLTGIFSLNPTTDTRRAWRPKEVATFTSYLENKINLKGICNGIKVNTPERLKNEIEKEKERKRRELLPRLLFQRTEGKQKT